MNKDVLLFLKGFFMGIANIIPGVSGGTIALVLGVYKELIKSIDSINVKNLRVLRNNGFKSFPVCSPIFFCL